MFFPLFLFLLTFLFLPDFFCLFLDGLAVLLLSGSELLFFLYDPALDVFFLDLVVSLSVFILFEESHFLGEFI